MRVNPNPMGVKAFVWNFSKDFKLVTLDKMVDRPWLSCHECQSIQTWDWDRLLPPNSDKILLLNCQVKSHIRNQGLLLSPIIPSWPLKTC